MRTNTLSNIKLSTNMYKRVLLKLSGESLMGEQNYGIDNKRLEEYAQQIKDITDLGVQVAIVIGGGNIFRGLSGAAKGFDRYQGDQMGMLATVINSLALKSSLNNAGIKARVLTAIKMEPVGEFYSQPKAIEALENGGTRVDGVYTADPEKDPTATKFDEITFDEIYNRGLKVMDLTATTMCKENNLPIVVFDMDTPGNLIRVIKGEKIGTLVKN
jgi:uridylate kinase